MKVAAGIGLPEIFENIKAGEKINNHQKQQKPGGKAAKFY